MQIDPRAKDRFWRQVLIGGRDECWLWRGDTVKFGHGSFRHRTLKIHLAHVFSYVLATGELPNGRWVLHSCDNPPCVNPRHLRWGSHQDNMRDMVERGNSTKGERSASAKLNEDQVREIHRRWTAGEAVTAIARSFDVAHQTVSHIAQGDTWCHLGLVDVGTRPTFCPNGHELTPENTIVESSRTRVWRRCVICRVASRERYNAERRAKRDAARKDTP
jgi:hypothetical protein